jgi:outer membrane protein assembly factor BamA
MARKRTSKSYSIQPVQSEIGLLTIISARSNVVRLSIGAGLTWAAPFGALTVDYAMPLSKAAYDVVQPLRFSAGGF